MTTAEPAPKQRAEWVARYYGGESLASLAASLGRSEDWVRTYFRGWGVAFRTRKQAQELRKDRQERKPGLKRTIPRVGRAEDAARKRGGGARRGSGNSPCGPSVGSVALDTRAGGRHGIVHNVDRGIAYMREPGSAESMWPCPVESIGPPDPDAAALARQLDAGVTLVREDDGSARLAA
ncbi:hypothetical protein [Kitasatospora cineracea]|uniref:Uncharacterized protein n=1 Tax=Kitasatospora cineracea TaxID=88074 RepID=A0A3N4S2N7_9ACTN|nr:hypothetical protein [Kitasatospora cineracea]RPE33220.1 hypothetical protein EDD38_1499 [Kitasatospora cineracea]